MCQLALLQSLQRSVAGTGDSQAEDAGSRCLMKLCGVERLTKHFWLHSEVVEGTSTTQKFANFSESKNLLFLGQDEKSCFGASLSQLISVHAGRNSNSSGRKQLLQGGTNLMPACRPSHNPHGSRAEKLLCSCFLHQLWMTKQADTALEGVLHLGVKHQLFVSKLQSAAKILPCH